MTRNAQMIQRFQYCINVLIQLLMIIITFIINIKLLLILLIYYWNDFEIEVLEFVNILYIIMNKKYSNQFKKMEMILKYLKTFHKLF